MSTGDRPNFPLANQRLDKVDIEAISDLIGENIVRTIGSLLGPCAGLVGGLTTNYSTTGNTLTIGACRLAYVGLASGSFNSYEGGIVRWDPTYSVTGGVVDVSSLGTTAGSSGYVFFKKSEIETDEENRAYYDALAQEKKVGVANTRVRETALFAVSSSYTGFTVADGWYPFLYLVWDTSGGSPTVYRISVFDSFGAAGSQRLNVQLARSRSSSTGYGVPWSQGHLGISRMLREVIGGLQHAYDNDFTLDADGSIATNVSDLAYRWAGYGLARGLKQLDADLTTAESAITSLQSDITAVQTDLAPAKRRSRSAVLVQGSVDWDAGLSSFNLDYAGTADNNLVVTISTLTTGGIPFASRLNLKFYAPGWTVTSVHITPADNTYPLGSSVITWRGSATATSSSLPFIATPGMLGYAELNVDVATESALVDYNFIITGFYSL
jgi:hypothetical protein